MNRSAKFTRLAVLLVALAALVLAGCEKHDKPDEAKEGGRVYVDGLFYQVQLSRQLNPKDVEDGFYLVGQPAPKAGESYFGVFMRVDNEDSKKRLMPVSIKHMVIKSARGTEYHPIAVKAEGWGYEPALLGEGARLPIPDTPADGGSIKGGLILFHFLNEDLDSRPLELEIEGPGGDHAVIELDV